MVNESLRLVIAELSDTKENSGIVTLTVFWKGIVYVGSFVLDQIIVLTSAIVDSESGGPICGPNKEYQ